MTKLSLETIINLAISEYKTSDEYAKRCLLNIKDSILIDLGEEYIKFGLLSIEYQENQECMGDYDIVLHISTDFVKDSNGEYDFGILAHIFYKFSIDTFGISWGFSNCSNGKIKNLFNLLLDYSHRVDLNIELKGCILYESGFHSTYNNELKQSIVAYGDKKLVYFQNSLKYLSGSIINFIGFNQFDCLNLLDFITLQKHNININIENFILVLGEEISLDGFDSELSIFKYYLENSCFSIPIYLFDFVYFDIEDDYQEVLSLLKEIYLLIVKKQWNLTSKMNVTFSFLFDSIVASNRKYYIRLRDEIRVYEDTFNFDYYDRYINSL